LGQGKIAGIGIEHWLNLLLFPDPYLPVPFSINLNSLRGKSGNQAQVCRSLNLFTRFLFIQSSVATGKIHNGNLFTLFLLFKSRPLKLSLHKPSAWFPKNVSPFWDRENPQWFNLFTLFLLFKARPLKVSLHMPSAWFPKDVLLFWGRENAQ